MRIEGFVAQPNGPQTGSYPWSISVPRWNSGMGLCISGFFVVMLGAALIANKGFLDSIALAILVWMFLLAGAAGILFYGKRMLFPPLALAANDRGLIVFPCDEKGRFSTTGAVVPWGEITSLAYEEYQLPMSGTGLFRMHALVVYVGPGSAFLLEKINVRRASDSFYVDVWSKNSGMKVVEELNEMLFKYSKNRQ